MPPGPSWVAAKMRSSPLASHQSRSSLCALATMQPYTSAQHGPAGGRVERGRRPARRRYRCGSLNFHARVMEGREQRCSVAGT